MAVAYLYVNAALYFIFAVWCLIKPEQTARFSGYRFINGSGKSEYLTIYVGLQAGLTGFYTYAALKEEFQLAGILFSVFLYAGIVTVRLISLIMLPAIRKGTYTIAALETLLGIGAIVSLYLP